MAQNIPTIRDAVPNSGSPPALPAAPNVGQAGPSAPAAAAVPTSSGLWDSWIHGGQKPSDQKEHEKKCLNKTKLCEHWLGWTRYDCKVGEEGKGCCYAHGLHQPDVPNEYGPNVWTYIWKRGEVDITFWQDYKRFPTSVERLEW